MVVCVEMDMIFDCSVCEVTPEFEKELENRKKYEIFKKKIKRCMELN